MIASLGGAVVDKSGARDYPGSGGLVGGLSMAGGNWSYWTGGGNRFNTFTPNNPLFNAIGDVGTLPTRSGDGDLIILQDGGGSFPPVIGGGQNYPIVPVNPTVPTIPTVPQPAEAPYPIEVHCLWGDCTTPTDVPIISPATTGWVPAARTNVSSTPNIFSFVPGENLVGGNGMQRLIIFAVIIFAVWWLYKKYA